MTEKEYQERIKNLEAELNKVLSKSNAEREKLLYILNASGKMAKVGGWELDLVNNSLFWSDEVYRIHEVDRSYIPELESAIAFYTKEALPLISEAVQKAIDERKNFNLELQINTARGNKKWVRAIGEPVIAENKVTSVIGTFQDISERKEAEMKLLKLNSELVAAEEETSSALEELSSTTESLRANIAELSDAKAQLLVSSQKNVIYNEWLESLLKIIHYEGHSMKNLLDFALYESISITESKIGFIYFYDEVTKVFTLNAWSHDVMESCTIENPETTYKLEQTGCWGEAVRQRKPFIDNNYSATNKYCKGTPHGHVELKKFLTVPVISDGVIVAVVGVANKESDYDMSDVQKLTLLHGYVWRIIEKENFSREIKAAKEKAEESDRLKSAFLANLSHEIRTPMNGILGFASLLAKPDLPAEKKEKYIATINESGQLLLAIITDIIEISKIETNQIKITNSEVCLNHVIERVIANFLFAVNRKNNLRLIFNKTLDDYESVFLTDAVKLQQIVSNLIENAIKFTDNGSVTISYKVLSSGFVEIKVSDTGIGIKQEHFELIFDRFRQIERTQTEIKTGTGLGLAISKAYVEKLGGKIWLSSEYGKGSEFCFSVPFISSNNQQPVATTKEISKESSRCKILVAEDNDINYEYLAELLSEVNAYVIRAKNGREAVDISKTEKDIDLILMDLKMPVQSGFDATKEIRSFGNMVPVIAQTAYFFDEEKELASAAGCNAYLAKPIKSDELFAVLKEFIACLKQ